MHFNLVGEKTVVQTALLPIHTHVNVFQDVWDEDSENLEILTKELLPINFHALSDPLCSS